MARRPDNAAGSLIFQEGKEIEGEFYIIAVYDDPASCTISFCAYELENDQTYTFPLTYTEFDAFFKYDAELMNPSNQDGRFHWVISRLDFVQDQNRRKVLCLAQEPTPEEEDDETLLAAERVNAIDVGGGAPTHLAGGKIDAATRVKLCKELDTQDDHKLHVHLVKSEDARKRFISKMQSMRQLQQEKASQRLLKTDEEREARLVKLDMIKKQQAEKARALKAKEAIEKSTKAQLELLMQKKEAQAIRRLMQEKDEQDRGEGRLKDAARARRLKDQRSADAVEKINAERAKQLARNRDDQVVKLEREVVKANRAVAMKVREVKQDERAYEVRLREEKDAIIEETWRLKAEERARKFEENERFEAMEETREQKNIARDKVRAQVERDRFVVLRQQEVEEKEETRIRRINMRREYLRNWRQEASERALQKGKLKMMSAVRERKIQEREELRLRKFRETMFLETAARRTLSPTHTGMEGADMETTVRPGDVDAAGSTESELMQFQKAFDQQDRQRRHAERLERQRQEEAKTKKMTQLTGPDPNARELQRIEKWRREDAELKKRLDEARLQRELNNERVKAEAIERAAQRADLTDHLEALRREASQERERRRIAACVERKNNLPIGAGLPQVLLLPY
mmetsp:Transcript_58792/g.164122  ORF Transcript_58792/g.164122 Transcript_58792/m.164122 type:complete len:633 (+) Transcript_58792:103-2001(+)|eukprot:CAMPEP_0117488286 /NCGR_PEP_ID=MMETSP0784-20121206/16439_1 /TAXON_ID=39447 /ORGANISM="" /LENGTH=632 /DNA_ID=CAMNT_0005282973 /DNA_START=22 /DNA_END=1920 /DNA_ORIENTATION=-